MLKEKVEKTIRKISLIPQNSKILVALSGGPDSVTLLHVLLQLKENLRIEVAAAHLNHMLRDEESERDEQFVKDLCRKWNVPLFVRRENVKEISKGKNVEAIAREVRYRFLEETLKKIDGDLIATGHTASDLVETVILNLTKGAGIKGLRGFLPKRDRIIRPLFEVTREEVERYVEENQLPFVIDSSNFKTDFERNLVRIGVIPVLKNINPRLEEAVLRSTEVLREIEGFLSEKVENLLQNYLKEEIFCVPLKEFKAFHPALRRELLREAFKRITGRTLPHGKVESIENLIERKGYKEFRPLEGFVVFKDQKKLCILKENEKDRSFFVKVKEFPSRVETPAGILEFDLWNGREEGFLIPYSEAISKGIIVRSRKPGDRLRFGSFSRPLKKVLIEKKISARERDILPVVQLGEEIVWIPGVYRAYINSTPEESYIIVRFKNWTSKS